MAVSGACASCRLRAVIRHHVLTRQRRQCISTSLSRRRGEEEEGYVDTLFQKFDRSLNQPPSPARAPGRSQQAGHVQAEDAAGAPRRGRYSRLPMQHEDEQGAYWQETAPRPHESRPREATRPSTRTQRPSQALHHRLPAPSPRRPQRTSAADVPASAEIIPNGQAQLSGVTRSSGGTATWLTNAGRRGQSEAVVTAAEQFMNTDDLQVQWECLQRICMHTTKLRVWHRLNQDLYFNRALFYWTIHLSEAYARSPTPDEAAAPQLPNPSVALNIRMAMTDDPSSVWPLVLCSLAKHVAKLRLADGEGSHAAAERGLKELMTVWSMCMRAQRRRSHADGTMHDITTLLEPPSIDFSFLPDVAAFRAGLQERGSHRELAETLDFLVPPLRFRDKPADFDFESAALLTLDLLQNWKGELDECYRPWMTLIDGAVQHATPSGIPRPLAMAAAEATDEQLKEYFARLMRKSRPRGSLNEPLAADENANRELPRSSHPLLQDVERPAALTEDSTDFDRFVFDAFKNLGRALEQSRLVFAQRTWQNVLQNAAKYQSLQMPQHLYHLALVCFLALRDQDKVLEIWQAMVKAGHRPTVKTYSIAMNGCRYIANPQLSESLWSNMRKAGLQPDGHAWSTRIFSLLKSRQIDAGLRALGEMSQEWLAVARQEYERHLAPEMKGKKKVAAQLTSHELAKRYTEDLQGVPRPDKVAMNSAITALAGAKDDEIPKVLSWARSFGIELDLTTYNALLNIAMRRGEVEEPLRILRRMETQGIQADGTTWTVLLTAMFEGGYLDDLEPLDQQERIMAFITSLESANAASIDLKGYALLIDRLSKQYNNLPAADAVLRHMAARQIEPSPHIYTIVMTSYFASDPPNIAAVEGLWNHMRTANAGRGIPLDAQFYDRMVEGYAQAVEHTGSTKAVEMFLRRMWNEGKKPSWKALTSAVRAFAARGEWGKADGLVARVRRDVQASRAVGATFGQRAFWGVVVEMGLIEGKDVPMVAVRGLTRW